MKSGARALGVAESYHEDVSTLAGVVTRADRVVDGVGFASCTVGGLDSTTTILDLFDGLGREDIQYLLVSGIAPAWYNVVDLSRLHEETGLPVIAVSYEESEGLATAIRDAFDGDEAERRLDIYRSLPERKQVSVGDDAVFVRAVGLDKEPTAVVRAFTPEGGRPEPVRVARLAARGAEDLLAAADRNR